MRARLVPRRLDATGAWQRLKYIRNHHLLLEADPWLAGLNTLQFCLWQRLEGRVPLGWLHDWLNSRIRRQPLARIASFQEVTL